MEPFFSNKKNHKSCINGYNMAKNNFLVEVTFNVSLGMH